jgi:hypothetical protein
MFGELTLKRLVSARIDLSVCIKPEMLIEAAACRALAGRIVDRQIEAERA